MEPTIDFDQLFALRVLLQDDFENESDIIKELRYELLQLGMTEANIPSFLKNFYENFGINISINTINESLLPNQQQAAFQNFIINNLLQAPIQVSMSSIFAPPVQAPPPPPASSEGNQEAAEDDDTDLLEDDLPPLPPLQPVQPIQLEQMLFALTNNGGNLENLLNNLTGQNGLFSLSTLFTNPPPNPFVYEQMMNPPMQDVTVTLDDNVLNTLKKYKLEKKLEDKCAICMTECDIEQEVTELPCEHSFHSECIEPYLKQYNYKCPICREEVGKPKYT